MPTRVDSAPRPVKLSRCGTLTLPPMAVIFTIRLWSHVSFTGIIDQNVDMAAITGYSVSHSRNLVPVRNVAGEGKTPGPPRDNICSARSSSSSSRAHKARRHFSEANSPARASPNLREPPVIRTILPASCFWRVLAPGRGEYRAGLSEPVNRDNHNSILLASNHRSISNPT
jgi:hypothetical protein